FGRDLFIVWILRFLRDNNFFLLLYSFFRVLCFFFLFFTNSVLFIYCFQFAAYSCVKLGLWICISKLSIIHCCGVFTGINVFINPPQGLSCIWEIITSRGLIYEFYEFGCGVFIIFIINAAGCIPEKSFGLVRFNCSTGDGGLLPGFISEY